MTQAFQVSIAKEVRALSLPWCASLAALLAVGLPGAVGLRVSNASSAAIIGVLAVGAILIGSWSIGHEFSGRTVSLWLTQPIARRSLWTAKLAVLAAMLLTLAVAAGWLLRGAADGLLLLAGDNGLSVVALSVLLGLTLAPCLTLVCRSPLAGAVFTIAILAAAWGGGAALSAFGYGPPVGPFTAFASFRLLIVSRIVYALAPLAAVTSWVMVMRLEAIDGSDHHVTFEPWRLRAVSEEVPVTRRPLWQLAKKELHVQQMTMIVAALYVLLWLANSVVARQATGASVVPMGAGTLLYCVMLGLLAGSLASAEERQFGTLEWQVLQPVASRTQWAIKAAMAFSVTAALGLGVPVALALLDRPVNDLNFTPQFSVVVFGACLVGLYVSSFATSGVRALLVSVLLVSVMGLAIAVVTQALTAVVSGPVDPVRMNYLNWRVQRYGSTLSWLRWIRPSMVALLSVAFVTQIWRLALRNHRAAERTSGVLPRQAVWLAASLLLAAAFFSLVDGAVNKIAVNALVQELERHRSDLPPVKRPATD